MYLGLDISTSCIGWSILDENGCYVDGGYIDFSSKKLNLDKNLFLKMEYFEKRFSVILNKYKNIIKFWAVEEAVKKFSFGMSSAGTIFKLASFNFGVVYSIYKKLGTEPTYIPANKARKTCSIQFPKDIDKENKKRYILDRCAQKYPSIVWDKNRADNIKKQCFDLADSVVIAEALYLSSCHKKPKLMKDLK